MQEAQKREGLWVHCVGTFVDIQENKATVKLKDGTDVSFFLSRYYLQKTLSMDTLSSLKGEVVTVLGQWGGENMGTGRLCKGEVDDCGVEDPQKNQKMKITPRKP